MLINDLLLILGYLQKAPPLKNKAWRIYIHNYERKILKQKNMLCHSTTGEGFNTDTILSDIKPQNKGRWE